MSARRENKFGATTRWSILFFRNPKAEVRMCQSISHCDPLSGIKCEQPLDEVIEVSVNKIRWLDDVLHISGLAPVSDRIGANTDHQALACSDLLFALSCGLGLGPIEFAALLEVLWL